MERDADTETIGLATFGEVAHSVYRQEILCNSLCNTIMIRGWQGNLSSRYYQAFKNGGERGIRTLDTVARIHTFQACSFDHSDTSP